MSDNILKYVLATFQLVVALVVGLYFAIGAGLPIEDGTRGTIWHVLDWFMAVSLAIAVAASFIRKRGLGGEPSDTVTRDYFETNVTFYVALGVTLLFVWNWTTIVLFASDDPPSNLWAHVDTVFPLLIGANGFQLWRQASASDD